MLLFSVAASTWERAPLSPGSRQVRGCEVLTIYVYDLYGVPPAPYNSSISEVPAGAGLRGVDILCLRVLRRALTRALRRVYTGSEAALRT